MKKFQPLLLTATFFLFTLLSWLLLFRDQRALEVYSHYYPELAFSLASLRSFLLGIGLNSAFTLIFAALALLSFVSYFASLRQRTGVFKTIVLAVLFQVVVFFSYPILSTDIFDYVNSDRLAVLHGKNVWITPPSAVPEDHFYPLIDYQNLVRIYGPVNQFFYNLVTPNSDSLVLNIALHRAVVILFVLGSIAISSAVLKTLNPSNLERGLKLVFWNPLFVLETAGSGHNDILMVFFLLLSLLLFLKKRFLFSGITLALSIGVKTMPLLLLPFILLSFVRRVEVKPALFFLLGLGVTLFLLFLSMGTSLESILSRQAQTTDAYWQSLPMLITRLTPLANVLKPALALVLLVEGVRALRGKHPWLILGGTLLLYLLFFHPTLWNWYILWVLALVPFFITRYVSAATLGFTLTSLLAYPVYWLSLRFDYSHPAWAVIIYLVILSGPFFGLLYEKVSRPR